MLTLQAQIRFVPSNDLWLRRTSSTTILQFASASSESSLLAQFRSVEERAHFWGWYATRGLRVSIIHEDESSALFFVRDQPDPITRAVSEARCVLLHPITHTGAESTFSVLAPDRATVSDLLGRLAASGTPSVASFSVCDASSTATASPVTGIASELTQRQFDVLVLALERGFYDQPRRASVDDLAVALKVSSSTVNEHLRKAEERILRRFAQLLRAQVKTARLTWRKVGRPPSPPKRAGHGKRARSLDTPTRSFSAASEYSDEGVPTRQET